MLSPCVSYEIDRYCFLGVIKEVTENNNQCLAFLLLPLLLDFLCLLPFFLWDFFVDFFPCRLLASLLLSLPLLLPLLLLLSLLSSSLLMVEDFFFGATMPALASSISFHRDGYNMNSMLGAILKYRTTFTLQLSCCTTATYNRDQAHIYIRTYIIIKTITRISSSIHTRTCIHTCVSVNMITHTLSFCISSFFSRRVRVDRNSASGSLSPFSSTNWLEVR